MPLNRFTVGGTVNDNLKSLYKRKILTLNEIVADTQRSMNRSLRATDLRVFKMSHLPPSAGHPGAQKGPNKLDLTISKSPSSDRPVPRRP
ncbi:hypothetical protein TNCV_2003761 [Trichonephila clavipes]|nr:hypothetical protein TNCV_2003761 [Trichonephila clavipes]